MNTKQAYKLAYQLVRLDKYKDASYEQWDYAHYPTEHEIYNADLLWDLVQDCLKQAGVIRERLKPFPLLEAVTTAAATSLEHCHDKIPGSRIIHIANNFGLCYSRGFGRFINDGTKDRQTQRGFSDHYWLLKPSIWESQTQPNYREQQRERLIARLRQEFSKAV